MAWDLQILQEFLLDLAAQEREEYYLDQYGKVGGWNGCGTWDYWLWQVAAVSFLVLV